MLLIPAPPARPPVETNISGRPSATWGTTITGTTANVEGTTVELIAATDFDVDMLEVMAIGMQVAGSLTNGLVNIKTGASFGHTVIPNILVGMCVDSVNAGGFGPYIYRFPVRIPAGTRVGASLRASVASDTCLISVTAYHLGRWAGSMVEALGADTATSSGVIITPGAASEGTFTTVGTTGFAYRAVIMAIGSNSDGSIFTAGSYAGDLGIGGVVVAGGSNMCWTVANTSEATSIIFSQERHLTIPSGTVLQARLQSSGAANDNPAVVVYGIA